MSHQVPTRIWNDPQITVTDIGITAQNMDDAIRTKLWTKHSNNKNYAESKKLPNIIYDLFCETVKDKDSKASIPKITEIENDINAIVQWLLENKLKDTKTPNQITTLEFKTLFPRWIIEAGRKKVKIEHPSAMLLPNGAVENASEQFSQDTDVKKSEEYQKQRFSENNASDKLNQVGKLHDKTRSLFFSEKVESGYLLKKDCYLYQDSNLTKKSKINNGKMIASGSVLGGPTPLTKNLKNIKSVEISEPEPLSGYIDINNVKQIDLTNQKWKFDYSNVIENYSNKSKLQTNININSNTNTNTNINTNKHHPLSPTMVFNSPDQLKRDESHPWNDNDDEKMSIEEKTFDIGDPNDPEARAQLLKKYGENIRIILAIKKEKRTPEQVMTLWNSAFNVHDMNALKQCYSASVVSQQLVNHELQGREHCLTSFKNMFDSSDDIGLNVTNKIISDDIVVLEWKAWGTKSPSPSVSETQGSSNNNNGNGNDKDRFINGCGIFHVNNGCIVAQKLFWDQDVHWFSQMGVLKFPFSEIQQKLYGTMPPQLNYSSSEEEHDMINDKEMFARRGLCMNDLNRHNKNDQWYKKRKQFATGLFWFGVGIMFVYIVPKYLGKRKGYY